MLRLMLVICETVLDGRDVSHSLSHVNLDLLLLLLIMELLHLMLNVFLDDVWGLHHFYNGLIHILTALINILVKHSLVHRIDILFMSPLFISVFVLRELMFLIRVVVVVGERLLGLILVVNKHLSRRRAAVRRGALLLNNSSPLTNFFLDDLLFVLHYLCLFIEDARLT